MVAAIAYSWKNECTQKEWNKSIINSTRQTRSLLVIQYNFHWWQEQIDNSNKIRKIKINNSSAALISLSIDSIESMPPQF